MMHGHDIQRRGLARQEVVFIRMAPTYACRSVSGMAMGFRITPAPYEKAQAMGFNIHTHAILAGADRVRGM